MPQKYFNVKGAAEALGISETEVKQLLERRELHGYRDGADWKFKSEDIEQLAAKRPAGGHPAAGPAPAAGTAPPEEEEADVLLSEVELGQSDPGLSGTVIGVDKRKSPEESDVRLAESDVKHAESDIRLGDEKRKPAAPRKDDVASKVSQFEELDLTLDQDLTLEDSAVGAAAPAKPKGAGDSAVDLSGKKLEDDDLVLGGGGPGSDISIGGDSGISLVDPADSGLSLEAPLNLATPTEESLELGDEDLLGFSADTGSTSALKSEDDFQLTPMEEGADGEDSESGSQVIALDTEGEGDESATMIASGGSMAAMLDEDLGAMSGASGAGLLAAGAGEAALASHGDVLALEAGMVHPAVALPEAPYSIWNILGLVFCTLLLILVGMMMYDLLRNMWSWQGVHHVNSALMDTILSWFEK
ncbi:MAG: helix-turn-helix domain-containing protein [Thermoguttaceae bacterium]|jgi:excisionase family DNA binding protein